MDKKKQVISAQVILKPASGISLGQEQITSQNIDKFMPDRETAAQIQKHFAAAGFETGALVANSFSITAAAEKFEQEFTVKLTENARGGIEQIDKSGANSLLELPLHGVAAQFSHEIEAITFTPPPDFGPTSY